MWNFHLSWPNFFDLEHFKVLGGLVFFFFTLYISILHLCPKNYLWTIFVAKFEFTHFFFSSGKLSMQKCALRKVFNLSASASDYTMQQTAGPVKRMQLQLPGSHLQPTTQSHSKTPGDNKQGTRQNPQGPRDHWIIYLVPMHAGLPTAVVHWWIPRIRGRRTRATNVPGRNVSMAPKNIQMAAMDSHFFLFCCVSFFA